MAEDFIVGKDEEEKDKNESLYVDDPKPSNQVDPQNVSVSEDKITIDQPMENRRSQYVLKRPDGSEAWVFSSQIPEALERGYKFPNKQAVLPITDFAGRYKEVKAEDLPFEIKKGASVLSTQEMYDRIDEKTAAMRPELLDSGLTNTERALAAAKSAGNAMSLGVGKVISSAIQPEEEKAAQMVEETQPGTTIAANLVGSLLSGGLGTTAAYNLGLKGMPALIAAGAGEGAITGLSETLSEDLLGDAEVNASNYLASVGLSALLGGTFAGTLGSAGKAAGYLSRKIKPKTLPRQLSTVVSATGDGAEEGLQIYRIVDGDELKGIAKVRAPDKSLGDEITSNNAVLESVEFYDKSLNTPEGVMVVNDNLLNSYPSLVAAADNPNKLIRDAFERTGFKSSSRNGNQYLQQTEKLPEEVLDEDTMAAKYLSLVKTLTNEKPKGELKRVYDKLSDPTQKKFRQRVLDYAESPEKFTTDSANYYQSLHDDMVRYTRAAEEVRLNLLGRVGPEKLGVLTNEIKSSAVKAEDILTKLRNSKSDFDKGVVDQLDGLVNQMNNLAEMGDAPEIAKEMLRIKRRFSDIAGQKNFKSVNSAVDPESGDVLGVKKELGRLIDNPIRSEAVLGDIAEDFSDIQRVTSQLIDAEKSFKAQFMEKAPNGRFIATPKKIYAQLGENPIDRITSEFPERRYLDSAGEFREIVGKSASKLDVNMPEVRGDLFSTKMREFQDIRQAADFLTKLSESKGQSSTLGMITAGLGSTAGAAATTAAGIGWYSGAIAGQALAYNLANKVFNPVRSLNEITNLSSAIANGSNDTISFGTKALTGAIKGISFLRRSTERGLSKSEKTFNTVAKLGPRAATTLGVKLTGNESAEDQINKVSQIVDLMKSRQTELETIANIMSEYAPKHGEQIKAQANATINEVIKDLEPAIPREVGVTPNKKALEKSKKSLAVVEFPLESLRLAYNKGDLETVNMVKRYHPQIYSQVVAAITNELVNYPNKYSDMPRSVSKKLARMFGVSLEASSKPSTTIAIQSSYAQSKQQEETQEKKPPSRGTQVEPNTELLPGTRMSVR